MLTPVKANTHFLWVPHIFYGYLTYKFNNFNYLNYIWYLTKIWLESNNVPLELIILEFRIFACRMPKVLKCDLCPIKIKFANHNKLLEETYGPAQNVMQIKSTTIY